MVSFNPIGKVGLEEGRYFIELEEGVFDGVRGLEDFSHILVTWWCNLYDTEESRKTLVLEKPYKKGPDKVGVFATRSPIRPNPIGITPCNIILIDRDQRHIYMPYIDAEPGTPVLDIKPYQASIDRVRDYKYPDWASHWPTYYEESATFNWEEEFNF
jgi:tRNA-Thr(GGU) m(6)t(6)A37 methyltransferase TsaA